MDSLPPNTIGAILFVVYVLAALGLTALLISDQVRLGQGQRTPPRTYALATLAAVAFATLSTHMLRFLIIHYGAWAGEGPGAALSPCQVWAWLRASRLFRTFAAELCAEPSHVAWVQVALLHALLGSVYMAVEGTRREIPHLWAYHALAQILPFGFVQNVFLLALRRKPLQRTASGHVQTAPRHAVWPAAGWLQLAVVGAYVANVLGLGVVESGASLLATVWVSRVLLFMPFLLMTPWGSRTSTTEAHPIRAGLMDDAAAWHVWHHQYKWLYRSSATAYVVVLLWRTYTLCVGAFGGAPGAVSARLFAGPRASSAVAALGYDWMIGIVSMLISSGLKGPEIRDASKVKT